MTYFWAGPIKVTYPQSKWNIPKNSLVYKTFKQLQVPSSVLAINLSVF